MKRLLALSALAFPVAAEATEVGRIRAHLVYENSGMLSPDILAQEDFAGWNTVIGEGSAEEPANDLLVLVELVRDDGSATPLRIQVRDGRGRVVGQRTIAGPYLFEASGVWKPLLVQNVGCAGTLRITATVGRSTRSAEVSLDCGE